MHPAIAYIVCTSLFEFGLAFTITTYAPYLLSIGLDLSDVSIINFWFWGAILLCELPTGMFADRVSRLGSVRIGLAFVIIGCAFYTFASDFLTALTDEILIGIGFAFISGAMSAWIKDAIVDPQLYAKIVATGSFARSIALVIGGWIGGIIAAFNYRLAWVLSAMIVSIALILNFKFMSEDRSKSNRRACTLRASWNLLRSKSGLLWAVVASAAFGLVLPFNHYWTSFFLPRVGQVGLAWLWIPMFGASAIASICIRRFIHRHEMSALGIAVSSFVAGLSLLLTGLFSGLMIPLGIAMIHEACRGIFLPMLEVFTQRHVDSAYRATFGSLQSFITRIGYVGVLLWGWWYMRDRPSSESTIVNVWVISGALLALIGFFLWFFRPKERLS